MMMNLRPVTTVNGLSSKMKEILVHVTEPDMLFTRDIVSVIQNS